MKHLLQKISTAFLLILPAFAQAQTPIKIESRGAAIDGYFYAAKTASSPKAPVIVALHGCGGMLEKRGLPNQRTRNYAQFFASQGWHVLFLDSLTARGVSTVCGGSQRVTQAERVADVQAAVDYLAKHEQVDAIRIGILGFSHGGTATLLSSDASVSYGMAPRAFVAMYPGCGETNAKRIQWQPVRPVLMQLGGADDWTSPVPCQQLAEQWKDVVKQDTYPDAHHGFDSDGTTLRAVQLDTPKGKKTVHTGGNPAAKAASQAKMIAFFKDHFK